jgi:hypothetical protein
MIPKALEPLFWEYEFGEIEWDSDRDLIIRRVLSAGGWEAISWLRKELGDQVLREWIIATKGRSLNPRQLRFWQLILDLPARTVSAWIKESRRYTWTTRVSE